MYNNNNMGRYNYGLANAEIPAHVPPKEEKYENPPTIEPADDYGKQPVVLPQLPPKLLPINYQPYRFPSDPFEASGKSTKNMPLAKDAATPPGRWMHTTVTIKDNVFVYGGVSNSETLLNDVWIYNPTEGTWWKVETATKPVARKPVNPKFKNSENAGRPPFLPAPPHLILPPGVKRPEEQVAKKNENPENQELKVVHLSPLASEEPQQPYAQSLNDYKTGKLRRRRRRRRLLELDLTKDQLAVLNRHAHILKHSTKSKDEVDTFSKIKSKSTVWTQSLRANNQLHVQQAAATNAKVETKAKVNSKEPDVGNIENLGADKNQLNPKSNTHVLSQPLPLNEVWIYNIAERHWFQPLPTKVQPPPRWLHSAIAVAQKILIFGGVANNLMLLNDVWIYDPSANKWERAEVGQDLPMPLPREGHSMVLANEDGRATMFGGISYGYKPFNDVWEYSISDATWMGMTYKKDDVVPPGRWMHAAAMQKVVVGGSPTTVMTIYGGCSENFAPLDDVWVYTQGKWKELHPTSFRPPGRWLHTANIIPSSITDMDNNIRKSDGMLIFGGAANNAPMEDMWIFDGSDYSWQEVSLFTDRPIAREGHTMSIIGKMTMEKFRRRRRRRLQMQQTEDSESPTKFTGIEEAMDGTVKRTMVDPRDNRARPTGSSDTWILLFGGSSEKGLVSSVQQPREESNLPVAVSINGCQDPIQQTLTYCNTSLPFAERVADLIKHLTLEEKLNLTNSKHEPIKRLSIPGYDFGHECLHGTVVVSNYFPEDIVKRGATVFPQPLGLAASYDTELLLEIGRAISDETRGISNANGQTSKGYPSFLDCWSPNINIYRDPRWGRGSETYGEDPTLTSNLLTTYVEGIQNGYGEITSNKFVKVISTLKHFVAYSLEEAEGEMRFYFDAKVTEQDLQDTYLPSFKHAITVAKAKGVMCSYNQVNGVPMCANNMLLEETLRKDWLFNGSVVSDCGAVGNMYDPMYKFSSIPKAAAASMMAGTDMNCGTAYTNGLSDAIKSKLLDVSVLDKAISRTLLNRFEVGQFDPPDSNPYSKIPFSIVGSEKHLTLARRAAAESVVLLKNTNDALPFVNPSDNKLKYNKFAIIGPNADDSLVLLGNYHGLPAYGNVSTPLQAMQNRIGKENILTTPGVNVVTGDGAWGFNPAIDICNQADIGVFFIGSSSKGSFNAVNHLDTVEKESMDRKSIDMPGLQLDLVKAVLKKTNISIIIVLIDGGPIAIEELVENDRVVAIVNAFYPGQMGGEGIVDVLMGDVAIAGKLPTTIYFSNYTKEIEATNMNMRIYPGRTYKFVQVPVLFEFGYGLSYTKFQYNALTILKKSVNFEKVPSTPLFDIAFNICNVGNIVSDVSVLLFLSYQNEEKKDIGNTMQYPKRELKYFQKLKDIKPVNQSDDVRTIQFQLKRSDFELVDRNGKRKFTNGKWKIEVNHDSILSSTFNI